MCGKIFVAAAGMAVAISGLSVASVAAPVTAKQTMATTSSARMAATDRRLDRFINRIERQDTRLYVSRDNGQRVALNQPAGSYRLNR